MMSELEKDLISVLIKHDVIDEESIEDYKIRREYIKLREDGMSGKKAKETLADRHNKAYKTIEYILYIKKRKL